MNFHDCPAHGEEPCYMLKEAMNHGCAKAQIVFSGVPNYEREWYAL